MTRTFSFYKGSSPTLSSKASSNSPENVIAAKLDFEERTRPLNLGRKGRKDRVELTLIRLRSSDGSKTLAKRRITLATGFDQREYQTTRAIGSRDILRGLFERLGVLPNSGHATPHLSNTLVFAPQEIFLSMNIDNVSGYEFSILFITGGTPSLGRM